MALPGLRRLFRLVVRPPAVEQDVDAELEFHLEAEAARLIGLGRVDPNLALRAE